MKNLLIITLMLLSIGTSAQISTNMSADSVAYLTAEQEAYMIDKEAKYLFKSSPLQYEQKLSNAFSFNLTIAPDLLFGRVLSATGDETFLSSIFLQSEAELRYYYKLPKLIKEGKQANNLSSTYLGFGGKYGQTVFQNDKFVTPSDRSTYQLFAAWGDQKRFLNYGYLDYGLELSYQRSTINDSPFSENGTFSAIVFSTRTKVGFALGQNYDIKEEAKCPIFKCYLDRRSAFKFNYNSLFAVSYGESLITDSNNQLFISINPNMAYEHKIGNTPFSINQDLGVALSLTNTKGLERNEFGVNAFSIDYALGGRYYFKLSEDIKKGKSGNNLSGVYVFLRGNYNRYVSEFTFNSFLGGPVITKYKNENIRAEFGIGYQKTVLNDMYFDLQFGLRPRLKSIGDVINESEQSLFILDIKVGKMF